MLERQIADLRRLLGSPFAMARSTMAPVDSGVIQTVQLRLDPLSLRDNVPVLYNYGHTGRPPPDADFHVAYIDGLRSKALAVASNHQSYRLTGLGVGDSALYDMRGAYCWLAPTGPQINGQGNPTLVTGDLYVTGEIYTFYGAPGQVSVGQHRHTQNSDSHGDTEQPTNPPIAGT